jgi:hypothetical protein
MSYSAALHNLIGCARPRRSDPSANPDMFQMPVRSEWRARPVQWTTTGLILKSDRQIFAFSPPAWSLRKLEATRGADGITGITITGRTGMCCYIRTVKFCHPQGSYGMLRLQNSRSGVSADGYPRSTGIFCEGKAYAGALTLDSHHCLASWLWLFSSAGAWSCELDRGREAEEYLGAGWLDCILAFLDHEVKIAAACPIRFVFSSVRSPPREGEGGGGNFARLRRDS